MVIIPFIFPFNLSTSAFSSFVSRSLSDVCWETISQLNKMYNQAINDLTISQEKVERLEVIKWINVEERLPECDGIFLVCTIAGDVDMIEFNNGAFGVEHQNIFIPARQGLITHWQPLPQPTK